MSEIILNIRQIFYVTNVYQVLIREQYELFNVNYEIIFKLNSQLFTTFYIKNDEGTLIPEFINTFINTGGRPTLPYN